MANQDLHEFYKIRDIDGTKCIVWQFHPLPYDSKAATKAKAKRKKIKEQVGKTNLNIPTLDTRYINGQGEFCDSIIWSDGIEVWDKVMCEYYMQRGYTITDSELNHGRKRTVKRGNYVCIVISIWPKSNKLMVQPGNEDSDNLLTWIADTKLFENDRLSYGKNPIPEVQGFIPVTADPSSKPCVVKPKSMTQEPAACQIKVVNIPPEKKDNQCKTAEKEQPSSPDTSVLKGTETVPASKPLILNTNKQNDNYQDALLGENKLNNSSSNHNGANMHGNMPNIPVIINELLCFLQNKMDTVPKDVLSKACTDFFDPSYIYQSKQLLFDTVNPDHRMKKHRGSEKSKEDINDIYKVLLELGNKELVHFVAHDLNNVPPLSINNFDIMKLVKEIEVMKSHLSLLTDSQSEIVTLIQAERTSQEKCSSPIQCTSSSSSSSLHTQKQTYASVVKDASVAKSDVNKQRHMTPIQDMSNRVPDSPITISTDSDDDGTESLYETWSEADISSSSFGEINLDKQEVCSNVGGDTWSSSINSEPWQRTQRRRRWSKPKMNETKRQNKDIVHGNGTCAFLRAAPSKNSYGNKTITGVFVTRLDSRTTSWQLESHIKQETGLLVKVEKLRTKYDSYTSFYIRCENRIREQLLCPYIWPSGSMVKPYKN